MSYDIQTLCWASWSLIVSAVLQRLIVSYYYSVHFADEENEINASCPNTVTSIQTQAYLSLKDLWLLFQGRLWFFSALRLRRVLCWVDAFLYTMSPDLPAHRMGTTTSTSFLKEPRQAFYFATQRLTSNKEVGAHLKFFRVGVEMTLLLTTLGYIYFQPCQ